MMTSKEKKEYAILAILVCVTASIIYFNFIKKSTGPKIPAPDIKDFVVAGNGPAGAPITGVDVQGKSSVATSDFKLDLNTIAQDPRFTRLQAPVYPTVTREELGTTNPFKPSNTVSTTPNESSK